jgi:N-acetylglucosamine-6-phosphate deacetylase
VDVHEPGQYEDPKALTDVDLNLVASLASVVGTHWEVMTFAPELSGSTALVEKLAASPGPSSARAYTDATAAETADALSRRRTQTGTRAVVTHVFNGMPRSHYRSPGPAAATLTAAARGKNDYPQALGCALGTKWAEVPTSSALPPFMGQQGSALLLL